MNRTKSMIVVAAVTVLSVLLGGLCLVACSAPVEQAQNNSGTSHVQTTAALGEAQTDSVSHGGITTPDEALTLSAEQTSQTEVGGAEAPVQGELDIEITVADGGSEDPDSTSGTKPQEEASGSKETKPVDTSDDKQTEPTEKPVQTPDNKETKPVQEPEETTAAQAEEEPEVTVPDKKPGSDAIQLPVVPFGA